MHVRNSVLFSVVGVFGMVSVSGAWAAGELHLTFHGGRATDHQNYVSGTLVNKGDSPVSHSYVVVTLLDHKCHPLLSVIENFSPIAVGEKVGFRVPVNKGLTNYRLATIKGFDSHGFEVPTVNEATPMKVVSEDDCSKNEGLVQE